MSTLPMGIYEKALPFGISWTERLDMARQAGFDYVEMSVDESDERLGRLDWSAAQRADFRQAIAQTGMPITTMCLSGHRKYALGSADPATRQTAFNLFDKAIDLAVDCGIRMIQLAGYYVYYEPHDDGSQARYEEGLAYGLALARRAGVMLALENVDGNDVDSVSQAMYFVERFNSPWFQVYPDVGNLAEHGLDVCAELERGRDHLVGIHVKDTRPGEPRRVPFGAGITPFVAAFGKLAEMKYAGPVMLEMWNDDAPDSLKIVSDARDWVVDKMIIGGLVGEEMRRDATL